MAIEFFIEVADRRSGETFVAACATPVRIGKQSGVRNSILLDAKYAEVSRSHGTIEEEHGRLVYVDQSSNGTLVDGARIHRSRTPLAPRYQLEIGPYQLRPVDAHPVSVVVTQSSGSLGPLSRTALLPGHGLAIREQRGSIAIADLNRWSQRNRPNLIRLTLETGRPHLFLEPAAPAVSLNRGKVAPGVTALDGGDVLLVLNHRIEILMHAAKYTVCANASCNLLNPHNAEANCRWCGYHLAGTGAVSRVII